jgi:uncharacterized protein with FMN-binding domain
MLFTKPGNLPLNQMLAAIVSVFLITDMLVLTVLSFPQVRRKMRAVTWKRIQRTAYLFYACLYVHVLLIHLPLARKGAFYSRSVVMVYSVVFICYAVMRVRKYILMKYREKLENAKFKHCINAVGTFAGLAVFFAVVLAAFTGNNVTKTIAADTENVKTEAATEKTIASTKGTEKATEENSQNSETTENDTSDSGSDETAKAEEADGGVSDEQISDDSASEEKTTEEKTSNDSGASSANVSEATQAVTQKEEKTEAPRKFKADGTYTGSAVCDIYGYTVTASVTISGDSITALSIDTTASGLDMDYADKAVNGLKRKLVSNQGTSGVDAVSGATYSSNAIFRAFENAVN